MGNILLCSTSILSSLLSSRLASSFLILIPLSSFLIPPLLPFPFPANFFIYSILASINAQKIAPIIQKAILNGGILHSFTSYGSFWLIFDIETIKIIVEQGYDVAAADATNNFLGVFTFLKHTHPRGITETIYENYVIYFSSIVYLISKVFYITLIM